MYYLAQFYYFPNFTDNETVSQKGRLTVQSVSDKPRLQNHRWIKSTPKPKFLISIRSLTSYLYLLFGDPLE